MKIDRILVVLDSDRNDWTIEDPVIRRAADLATRSDGSLILLKVAYESALGYGAFATREEVEAGRLRLLADCRENQTRLKQTIEQTYSLSVATDTQWSPDEADSVLRTAHTRSVDLIMKASGDHAYFVGLLSNTDWDLLRGARVPVWFVSTDADRSPECGIIAAIEQSYDDDGATEEFRLDHEAFNTAKLLSDRYASPLYAVHAYRVPRMLPGFEGYAPTLGSVSATPPTSADVELRAEIAGRHGRVVQDFVDEHGIPIDDLVLEEGPADLVLSSAADAKTAGLIVMGSSRKSWWDHLRGRARAEPTLSHAGCDVLFVKAPAAAAARAAA